MKSRKRPEFRAVWSESLVYVPLLPPPKSQPSKAVAVGNGRLRFRGGGRSRGSLFAKQPTSEAQDDSLACPDAPAATEYATVRIAWELSKADWKLGMLLPGAQQMSRFAVKGGDLAAVAARLAAARAKAALSRAAGEASLLLRSGLRGTLAASLA